MSDKCCCCFPLDCGITTLAVLTFIGSAGLAVECYVNEGMFSIYWPQLATCWLMSLFWIYTLIYPSESSKRMTHFAWLILVVIVGRISYLIVILNGSAAELFCESVDLEKINEELDSVETITVKECKMGGKYGLLADCIICWLLEIYWATAIRRWSR